MIPPLVCLALLAIQGGVSRAPVPGRLLVAATDDQSAGLVVSRRGLLGAGRSVAATDGGSFLRRRDDELFLVHPRGRTVTRLRRDGTLRDVYDLGPGSRPQDVFVSGGAALVTTEQGSALARIDLATGAVGTSVDLSVYAGAGETATGRTMLADGGRLLIQVRLASDPFARAPLDRGVLAVLDLASEELVDLDPGVPGVQGIALQGAPPRLPMQVVPGTRLCCVSTTDGRLDDRGGLELVDLDLLESVGFALREDEVGADLGGFVFTSPGAGFFVFHTDIVASTHLKRFTLAGGPAPGLELVTLLGDDVDALVLDAEARLLYLPTGFAAFGAEPGLFVLDADSGAELGFLDTPERAHDAVVSAP